ncbi:MAG: VirB8/TrbF family protein [Pseudonocardiaceae bacterium]
MMKTASQAPKKATPDVYIDARREWNERYGDLINQVKSWKTIALVCASGMAVAVGAIAWMGTQSRVVPYIVQVDQLKTVMPVGPADMARSPDAAIVRASLRDWVENVRTVTPDAWAQRQHVLKTYYMLQQGQAGFTTVTEALSGPNSPFKRSGKETVAVEVQSVLPTGGDSWRVEWLEITRARNGEVTKREQWSAVIAVHLQPPTDESQIMVNPLGIYIKNLSWSPRV